MEFRVEAKEVEGKGGGQDQVQVTAKRYSTWSEMDRS